MIKIRYRDADELSPGLHAAAERHGRNTTVFLLPGLTAAERRAALRRLRLSARRGYCPPLPAAQLALALAADRIRTTVGQVGTLIRSHPAGSTVPVMVLSAGAIAFLAVSAVSIQVLHMPRDHDRSPAQAIAAGGSPGGIPGSASPQARPAGPASPDPGLSWTSPAAPSPGSPSPTSSPTPAAGVTPTASPSDPTPSPQPPPTTSAPAPAPSPSGSPAMRRPSPTPTQSCLNLGPLGVCP